MESAIEPCVELVKCTGGSLRDQINLLWSLRRNLNNLKDKRDELVAKESDVKSRIGSAQEQGKLVLTQVSLWLEKVEKIKSEVSVTEDLFAEHKACCICSNCYARLSLAKRVVDKTRQVEDLVSKQLPDPLVIDPPIPIGVTLNPPPIVGGESTSEKIMKLLRDSKIGKIGVWGMGGVGKTTIMMGINDQLVAKGEFSKIIWVTASKDMGGIEGLQNRIAQHFGDNVRQQLSSLEDGVIRAAYLSQKLEQAGNFLLIIDDLWEKITLREVGIPEFDGENVNGKIVVTTRNLSVCDSIEIRELVEVECLPEEAAWELFVSKTGEYVLHSSDIEPLARQVLHECAGLPLAIVAVGCAMMRKKSSSDWRNALNALRNPTGDDLGLKDKVFKVLRFSYDNLKEEAKSCFLYCAFFPEDQTIDPVQLIEHWVVEGYTSAGGDQCWDWEAEIHRGFHILQELKDACLLQTFFESKDVTMHDLFRDLAIQIMWKDFKFISKVGMNMKKWPIEAFEKAKKISIVNAYLEAFPDQPICPNLSTLFLGKSKAYGRVQLTIPKLFFSQMLPLQVLNISNIGMTELPESLSDLVCLQALFLASVEVEKVPSLAKLKELQALSIRGCLIEEAPAGMEALVNLRLLDLTSTRGFKNFNADFISILALLEQLRMSRDFLAKSSGIANRCIERIARLEHLTNLAMTFDDFDNYLMAVKLVKWNKLKGFCIDVYPSEIFSEPPIIARGNYNRKLVWISFLDSKVFSTIQVPSNAQEVWLLGYGMPNQCSPLEYANTLASFENLTLEDSYFELNIDESLQEGCFTNLKKFTINGSWLKKLSYFRTMLLLKNLELVKLVDCELMEEIVEGPGNGSAEATSEICLPKLHTLILHRLPKVHHVSPNVAWICDSLKVVAVFGCPKLEQLPFNNFPTSGVIYGTSEWWEGLRWENPTRKALLQSRFMATNEEDAEICPLLQPDFCRT